LRADSRSRGAETRDDRGKRRELIAPEGYDPLELDELTLEAAAIVDELVLKRRGNEALT